MTQLQKFVPRSYGKPVQVLDASTPAASWLSRNFEPDDKLRMRLDGIDGPQGDLYVKIIRVADADHLDVEVEVSNLRAAPVLMKGNLLTVRKEDILAWR